MALKPKVRSGRSVVRRKFGIRMPVILAAIGIGAIVYAASQWYSADDDASQPPAPETVTADTEAESEAPPVVAEIQDAPRQEPLEAVEEAPPAPPEPEASVEPLSEPLEPSQAEARAPTEADQAEQQYRLGRAHLTGDGVKADPIEAVAWFILAAARGHEAARVERDKHLAAFEAKDRIAAAFRARALEPIIPAGWSADPVSGAMVWLPSWFRNGVFKLELDVPAADGRAEGAGKAVLTAGLRGYFTDRTFEDQFRNGYFFGERVIEQPFEMLPTDAYLVRLPDSGAGAAKGVAFWGKNRFGVAIAIHLCEEHSDLLAVVPDGFDVLDDTAVNAVIGEAARVYAGLCPTGVFADVTVVPAAHRRVIDRDSTVFEPMLAEATVDGMDSQAFKILHFKNHAAVAHEREVARLEKLREKEAARLKRERDKAAAAARGMPDVRGLRLGMMVPQVRALFADQIAAWQPPWDPNREPHPYAQVSLSIRLDDGATIDAKFTSPVNGSQLFSFGYEQNLRSGPSVDTLKADLIAKYGAPDDVDWRGNVWTYNLVSQRPNRAAGAWMRLRHLPHDSDGSAAVTYLGIGISDYGLGDGDEGDAYQARLEAERAAHEVQKEKEKSNKVTF